MELTTQYSLWYLILCAVLAGLYAFLLYGKNKQNQELPIWVESLLGGLRFFTVFILAALLLNPFIQTWKTQTEAPIIIFAQDNSESILNNADSAYYSEEYLNQISGIKEEIGLEFQLVQMVFGDEVLVSDTGIDFTEKRTNFAKLFDEIDARFAGDNIGAVIIASDGLYNSGANPEYYSFKQSYPVYTIGLGDTSVKSDISIVEIRTNDIVYLGNKFPVEVTINADLLQGRDAFLNVFTQGKLLEKRPIKITKDKHSFTENFTFSAKEEGTQRYIFKVTEFENELNLKNNTEQVLIDVLDNRDKILILANAPHPDVAAIRNVLIQKETYEVVVATANNFSGDFESFNLVIAHGFGRQENALQWQSLWSSKVPIWNILYGQTNSALINSYQSAFGMDGNGTKTNRIFPAFNSTFNTFKISDETRGFVRNVPPLTSPFSEIAKTNDNQTLLFQKLGSVETNYPLWYFDTRGTVKNAWLFGEGLWRWKMYNFQENQSFDHFSELVWKTVQYLSVKEDKSRFRLKLNKRYNENENVIIQAEFYDKSYEKTNQFNISLTLTDELENTYSYAFVPNNLGYILDIGMLPPGVYNYAAEVEDGSKKFKKSGSFIVVPVNVEFTKTKADFDVLKKLSNKTKGSFYLQSDLNSLLINFEDKSNFPSISYTSESKKELIHYKWIFGFILLLLTIEWLMRKLKGRY